MMRGDILLDHASIPFFKRVLVIVALLIMVSLMACTGESMVSNFTRVVPKMDDVSDLAWERLANQKIYFAHQSVGENIISGLHLVLKENPVIHVSVIESTNPDDYDRPVFGHAMSGRNEMPSSKDEAFAQAISSLAEKVDIAFYKYCYVDIGNTTDVDLLFNNYKRNIEALKTWYPKVKFVHLTVPLTVVQKGPMAGLRKMLGRNNFGYEENKRRNHYNMLLRAEYKNIDPIFDIADLESTSEDRGPSIYSNDGENYFSMDPAYASDGRHLNEKGRRYIAEQLLVFLAGLGSKVDS
jgi:hypothetical protein